MNNPFFNEIPYYGNGTTQDSRLLRPLLPDYAPLDDRQMEDILAYITEYAKHIVYYDANNEPNGNWERFFSNDISFLLANVICTNLEAIELEQNDIIYDILNSYEYEKKFEHLNSLFQHIITIAQRINDWYVKALKIQRTRTDLEFHVVAELENIIQRKLSKSLQILKAYDLGAEKLDLPMQHSYEVFHKIWGLSDIEEEINIFEGDNLNDKVNNASVQLRLLYRDFYNDLSYLVFNFRKLFIQSLEKKHDHKPDAALFITFTKLFRYVQEDLNLLTEKYLEFYYRTILHQNNKDFIPDIANVEIKLAEHIDEYTLPVGTLLTAGYYPDGQPILYKTNDTLEINKAEIGSLKTLYLSNFEQSPFGSYQIVTGIYAAPVANSKFGTGAPFDKKYTEFPLFGEEQANRTEDVRTMTFATIGFAISSPIFFLAEGNRKLSLKINFVAETAIILEKLVNDYCAQKNVTIEEALDTIFNRKNEIRNFNIFYSSPTGWVKVPLNQIKINFITEENKTVFHTFLLDFQLLSSLPAFSKYDSSVIEERFVTQFPVLKITLNEEISPYLYSFMRHLVIENIQIHAEVDKLKQVEVYNALGKVDTAQPFAPFGIMAEKGAYMIFGNAEIFKKELNDLQVNIEWNDIPDLEAHYRAYNAGVKLDSFKVKLSALTANRFMPTEIDDYEKLHLLKANVDSRFFFDDLAYSDNRIHYYLDESYLRKMQISPTHDLESLPTYDNNTQTGYFKLELIEPDMGLGFQLYQKRFTETVTQNAKKTANETPNALPNQPFNPTIKNVFFSYSASATINRSSDTTGQLYHIHPFGTANVYSKGAIRINKFFLLPQYDEDGYLYIGLKNLRPPQTLSMLFQLTASRSRADVRPQLPNITWSYLSNNQWQTFKDEQILTDTTDHFTRTGIVKLHIPKTANNRNSVLPNGLYWLKIAVQGDMSSISYALDIRTQVVGAVWEGTNEKSEYLRNALAPNHINSLYTYNPAIQKIEQPFHSFDGLPQENSTEFYRRVSERLRHKNRAITHWDYERLVLNKFHTIFQVKCLSHLSNPREIPQKEVVVVVIPRKTDSTEPNRPRVNYKTLQSIEAYLNLHTSPFAKLTLRNPDYEYLRIHADIRFSEGNNNGHSLVRLKEDLRRFMCPWLYNNQAKLPLGSSLNEDVILNFVKSLDYVRFVTKFSILHFFTDEKGIFQYIDTAHPKIMEQKPWTIEPKPWSVLIPDDDHQIGILQEEVERLPVEAARPVRFQDRIDIIDALIKISRRAKKEDTKTKSDKTFYLKVKF